MLDWQWIWRHVQRAPIVYQPPSIQIPTYTAADIEQYTLAMLMDGQQASSENWYLSLRIVLNEVARVNGLMFMKGDL